MSLSTSFFKLFGVFYETPTPRRTGGFLCLPVYAQSPDLGTVDYLRHDARTGKTQWIELDAGCLADAGMPWMHEIILDPSKSAD